MLSQTNIGTVSRTTLGRQLRDETRMGLSELEGGTCFIFKPVFF